MTSDQVREIQWITGHDLESLLREKYKLEKTDQFTNDKDSCYRMWRLPSGKLIPITNLKAGESINATYLDIVERIINIIS